MFSTGNLGGDYNRLREYYGVFSKLESLGNLPWKEKKKKHVEANSIKKMPAM